MAVENAEYFVILLSTPSKAHIFASEEEKALNEEAMGFVRLLIIGIRIGLNIHPWLVGVTSARAARLAFEPGRSPKRLTLRELVWSLWPSAAAHAVYDMLITILPGGFALLMPGVFWYGARHAFQSEWAKVDSAAGADPVGADPGTSPEDHQPQEEGAAAAQALQSASASNAAGPRSTSSALAEEPAALQGYNGSAPRPSTVAEQVAAVGSVAAQSSLTEQPEESDGTALAPAPVAAPSVVAPALSAAPSAVPVAAAVGGEQEVQETQETTAMTPTA
jgi:hypothetical protein